MDDAARDTRGILHLLADWALEWADRHRILAESPTALFFADLSPSG